MFPELDDRTYTPVPSDVQLAAIKSRGASLRRRRHATVAAVPIVILAAAIAVLLPTVRAEPTPQPAAPAHELGSVLSVPPELAPSIVTDPLEAGADIALVEDVTPGSAVTDRLFLFSEDQVRELRGIEVAEPALSPDGRFVAYRGVGFPSSTLELLDVTTGEQTTFRTEDGPAYSMETGNQLWWSRDGSVLADGYWTITHGGQAIDPRVRIWHVDDDGQITGPTADGLLPDSSFGLSLLGMSSDGDELLALSRTGRLMSSPTSDVAFADTGIRSRFTNRFGGRVEVLAGGGFSPDGERVGAFVHVSRNISGDKSSQNAAWVLDLDSQRWTSSPLRFTGDFRRPPAGWSGDVLTRVDARGAGTRPVVVRPLSSAPESQVVLTFEPVQARVESISLATARVYYSQPTLG